MSAAADQRLREVATAAVDAQRFLATASRGTRGANEARSKLHRYQVHADPATVLALLSERDALREALERIAERAETLGIMVIPGIARAALAAGHNAP